jgi:hypothetical protein
MKKLVAVAMAASVLLVTPLMCHALPFADPDIYLKGNEYTAISTNPGQNWTTNPDGSISNLYAGQWVEYSAYLAVGNWNIGLDVINQGNLGTGWYNEFQVYNGLTNTVFTIPASDTEVFNGYFNTDITTAGTYRVRYTWKNDKWVPGTSQGDIDANIRIIGAFFDDPPATNAVPEPATLLLLGSGLLGLGLMRNRKKNA